MLFWKIFAVIDVFLALAYSYAVWTGKERLRPSDALWTPIWLVGTVGVTCYAFSLESLHPLFWHYFLPAYAAASAWEIASVVKDAQAEMGIYGLALRWL